MKNFSMILVLVLLSVSLGAQGVVTNIKGKVEVQAPGQGWEPAEINSPITLESQISTGFNSQATVVLDKNTVVVRPLTRMSLGAYTQKEGLTTTTLRLTAGRVRVNVNSTEDRKNSFTVQTPVATASVRGTVFEFDGFRLEVEEGVVQMVTPSGNEIIITKGGATVVQKDSRPQTPKQLDEQKSEVPMVSPPGQLVEPPVIPNPKDTTLSPKGSIVINLE